ncbi:alpha-1,2-fucosyltransferase [Coprobacter sp.]
MALIKIIASTGGLGNQMFQYAFYLALKKKRKFVLLQKINSQMHERYGFELERPFGTKPFFLPLFVYRILLNRHFKKFWCKTVQDSFSKIITEVKSRYPVVYYSGFWQSENYFKDIESEVRKSFCFDVDKLNIYSKTVYKEILASPVSVSIHIRRGDYLKHPAFLGICTDDYYIDSIALMKDKFGEDIVFYIFSDDLEYADKLLKGRCNFRLIDGNRGVDSWQDMFLMSVCDHNIVANSTFSWW